MPRRPRLVIPGIPMHVTQRGVNRAAIFADGDDRNRYRGLLAEVMTAHELPVHAYALMGNHVHLLMTANEANSLAHAMRLLNQRYVASFNRRHHRTGTLWESRFRSCLVESEPYLLTVYRYIDLNPVRAGMVDSPEEYRWSSARANLGLAADPCLTPHPLYLSLGTNTEARAGAYRDWMGAEPNIGELGAIRAHMQQERVLGSPGFQAMIENALSRPVALRRRGRPGKVTGEENGWLHGRDSNG